VTRHKSLAAILLVSGACAADIGEAEDPGLEEVEAMSLNAMSLNAMSLNALSANFAASQAMVDNPLDTESYNGRVPELENQLSDDLTQEFMHYLVGCALKPGQYVKYEDHLFGGIYDNTWEGSLGLCPDWHYGPADQTCQEVVSSCLLARVNAFGVSVAFSMRGHDGSGGAIPLGPTEITDFPWREGGFYGDVFEQSALADGVNIHVDKDGKVQGREGLAVKGPIYTRMYACVSSVWTYPDAYAKDRICAGGSTNCAAKNVGACRYHQTFGPSYRCGYHDDPATGSGDKDYQVCKDDSFGVWKNAVTTFLKSPCSLYPKGQGGDACQVTSFNAKYGAKAWDAYDAKGGKL
jgi:hypothetical protein